MADTPPQSSSPPQPEPNREALLEQLAQTQKTIDEMTHTINAVVFDKTISESRIHLLQSALQVAADDKTRLWNQLNSLGSPAPALGNTLTQDIRDLKLEVKKMRETLSGVSLTFQVFTTRYENSLLGREDRLMKVPNSRGEAPSVFPDNIMMLLVAGNEKLPNGETNSWNKKKSQQLLKFYGQEDSDSESESEYTPTSRERRLNVAKQIGASKAQLNFAQLSL